MSTIRVQPDRVLPIGTTERRRTFRVVALAAGLVIFGLGDLYSTILHSVHVGIHEVNPIGAYLISEQSLWGLILFKLGTLGISVGLLLKVRHHRSAEIACWALLGVMIALTVYWYAYNGEMVSLSSHEPVVEASSGREQVFVTPPNR